MTGVSGMKKRLSKKQGFQLLVRRYQQENPRLDSTEMPQKTKDAGSRKRIYRLTRCESVKVQNRLSQSQKQDLTD